jgi:hypothetical protein
MIIKHIIRSLIPVVILIAASLTSCDKGDGNASYGIPMLYMPQAMSGGGMDNIYTVPSGDGDYTYNFKIDQSGGRIDVILGVLRSGLLDNAGYTVDIVALDDITQQTVRSGNIENALAVPVDIYSVPSRVNVPEGKSGETFYMSVSVNDLQHEKYTGRNLVVAIGLSNPSRYELHAQKSHTVVVIDIDAICQLITDLQ